MQQTLGISLVQSKGFTALGGGKGFNPWVCAYGGEAYKQGQGWVLRAQKCAAEWGGDEDEGGKLISVVTLLVMVEESTSSAQMRAHKRSGLGGAGKETGSPPVKERAAMGGVALETQALAQQHGRHAPDRNAGGATSCL